LNGWNKRLATASPASFSGGINGRGFSAGSWEIAVDDAPSDHSVFSKIGDRLLKGYIAAKLLAEVLARSEVNKFYRAITFRSMARRSRPGHR
jgi:hypothetical protein